MIKQGDIVKLRNPVKKGEAKRRWEILIGNPAGCDYTLAVKVLDILHRGIELHRLDKFIPLTWWEKLMRRIHG